MPDETRYPLCWPERWPRTKPQDRQHSRFTRPVSYAARWHSMDESFRLLSAEMGRLGARHWLLSSNVPRNQNGAPRSNAGKATDPGAALYFTLNGRKCSLACDKWLRVECNVWAIAKHIEALRSQERWGVGSVEQAFRGYVALPGIGETNGSSWWDTLGVPVNASADQVRDAYRLLAKKHHPDGGGDPDLFRRIAQAYEHFKQLVPANS